MCGGKRHGVIYEATLLENVPWDCNIVQNEVFGPVACLFPYDGYKKAVDMCAPPPPPPPALPGLRWSGGSNAWISHFTCVIQCVGFACAVFKMHGFCP